MMLHRFITKIINIYKRNDVKIKMQGLFKCGKDVTINYPFSVNGEENITIGDGTTILDGARMQVFSSLTGKKTHLTIGSNCYFCYRLTILAGGDVTIGDHVLMASDISIISHNHGINPEEVTPYMDQTLQIAPIVIGDNCWLGDKVVVTAGVTIGKGCVVGSNSVVTHDIPDYSIAVGAPARVIKQWDFGKHRWENVE